MFKEGSPGDVKEPRKSSTEKDQNNITSYRPHMKQSDGEVAVEEHASLDDEMYDDISFEQHDPNNKLIELKSIIEGAESNYLVNELVTHGTYGQVFKAITVSKANNNSKGTAVALKFLPANGIGGQGSGKVKQELTSRCQHENILSFTEAFEFSPDPRMMIIVMPYDYYQSLERCMKRDFSGYLPHALGYKIAKQLASALVHLKEKEIIHLDIKPGNILVTALVSTQGKEHIEIKLADLGISKHVLESDVQASQLGGTKHFIAPEVFKTKFSTSAYSYRADVYSMGATLYNVLSGEFFDFEENVEFSWPEVTGWAKWINKHPYKVCRGYGVEIPAPLMEIISGCLVLDHERRSHAEEVLKMIKEVTPKGEKGQKRPADTSYDVKMKPADTSYDVKMKPADTSYYVKMKPADTSYDVKMKPADTSYDVKMKIINDTIGAIIGKYHGFGVKTIMNTACDNVSYDGNINAGQGVNGHLKGSRGGELTAQLNKSKYAPITQDEWDNVVSDRIEWFQPLDIGNSFVCLTMNLNCTVLVDSLNTHNENIDNPSFMLERLALVLISLEEKVGKYTICKDILYNPAKNMKPTIFVKFNEFNGNLIDIQSLIYKAIDFTCDTIDLMLNSARSLACYANPEMETLEIDVWRSMEWQSLTDNHTLSDYTQSIESEHGDFVMFGPTYDYATKSWSNIVCLWILYSDPISRHFMYKPNEQRVSSHRGLRVQHFYGRLVKQNKQRFVATDIRLRESWYLTDASKDIYVGNAFFARHPTIHSGYKRRATIGPSVRSLCRDLPSKIIPDNWFVTAAHTFAEPDETIDGKHIPPIPLNTPIFETLPGVEPESYRKIGTYLSHDKSQCVAIIEITCPKMLNLIKVTQQDIVDIVGPESNDDNVSYLDNIHNLKESPIWKDVVYKTGCTTATTRGYAHSHGSLLNPRYKGHSLYGPRCAQYIMVQSVPVVIGGQTILHNFSENGDSGAGVFVLTPSKCDADQYSAKVFGLLEGAMEFNARSGPISVVQPVNVQSLRNLALRTAHYQSTLFNAIQSFEGHPAHKSISNYVVLFLNEPYKVIAEARVIICRNLLVKQAEISSTVQCILKNRFIENDEELLMMENYSI